MRSRFIWELLDTKIDELNDLSIMNKLDRFLYKGSRFYLTYYICPCCKERLLYKTNTVGDFTVVSECENQSVTSVFTCPHCRAFFASRPGMKLANGDGFKIKNLTDDSYMALLNDIESVGIIG